MKIKKSELQKLIQEELMEVLRVDEAAAETFARNVLGSNISSRRPPAAGAPMGTSIPTGTGDPTPVYGADPSQRGTFTPPTAEEKLEMEKADVAKELDAINQGARTAIDCLTALHIEVSSILESGIVEDNDTNKTLTAWKQLTALVPFLEVFPEYATAFRAARGTAGQLYTPPSLGRYDWPSDKEKTLKGAHEDQVAALIKINTPPSEPSGTSNSLAALKSGNEKTFLDGWLKPLYESLAAIHEASLSEQFSEGLFAKLVNRCVRCDPDPVQLISSLFITLPGTSAGRAARFSGHVAPFEAQHVFVANTPAAILFNAIQKYETERTQTTAGTGRAPERAAGGHEDVGFGPLPTQEQLTRMVAEELHKLMAERNNK